MKHLPAKRQDHAPVEAVTVCINYADHLKYCLSNRFVLDKWVIVTVADDLDTIRLCKRHSIEYVLSEKIFEGGAEFSKGKAINEGMARLSKAGWIVVMDSDVVLPADFRQIVDAIPMSNSNLRSIFGCYGRRLVAIPESYKSTSNFEVLKQAHSFYKKEFKKVKSKATSNFQDLERLRRRTETKFFHECKIQTIQEQWNLFSSSKWDELKFAFEDIEANQLGYFQMYHSKNFRWYPEQSKTSAGDDLRFSKTFPSRYRKSLIMDCVHIGPTGPGVGKLLGNLGYIERLDAIISGRNSAATIRPRKHRLHARQILAGTSWFVWGQHILNCKRKMISSNEGFRFFFNFSCSKSPTWFFSLYSNEVVSLIDKRHLCFDFKVSKTCNLELGYGHPILNRSSWFHLKSEVVLIDTWQTIRLPIQSKNGDGFTSIAIRGLDLNRELEISVSEPYFEK